MVDVTKQMAYTCHTDVGDRGYYMHDNLTPYPVVYMFSKYYNKRKEDFRVGEWDVWLSAWMRYQYEYTFAPNWLDNTYRFKEDIWERPDVV